MDTSKCISTHIPASGISLRKVSILPALVWLLLHSPTPKIFHDQVTQQVSSLRRHPTHPSSAGLQKRLDSLLPVQRNAARLCISWQSLQHRHSPWHQAGAENHFLHL